MVGRSVVVDFRAMSLLDHIPAVRDRYWLGQWINYRRWFQHNPEHAELYAQAGVDAREALESLGGMAAEW